MRTKIISCEVEVPGDIIRGKIYKPPFNGEISVYLIDYGVFVIVPLDDLSDDSRQVVLHAEY